MCSNPFGGNDRLDRIDFMDFASGTDSPFKLLYLKVISDAASDYLFFGLGKNGTVPDDFWYATEYFFTCKSYLEDTWKHAKFMRKAYVDEDTGKRVSSTLMLSDEELKQTCFDRHYEIVELHKLMPIERFVSKLEEQRLTILVSNWQQTQTFLNRPFIDEHRLLQALVRPESSHELAECLLKRPSPAPKEYAMVV